jgi:hypothetical protein
MALDEEIPHDIPTLAKESGHMLWLILQILYMSGRGTVGIAIILIISLMVWCMGLVAAVRWHDWMWFARAGALTSGIAVCSTILRVRYDILIATQPLDKALKPEFLKMDEATFKSIFEAKIRTASVNVSVWESALIFLSTIIWGFGDLLVKVFH